MRTMFTVLAVSALLGTGPVLAQTTPSGRPAPDAATSEGSGGQKAVARPNTDRPDAGNPASAAAAAGAKLEPGSNSFTEAQTRSRLEQAGYKEVQALRKDDQGIWRGTATLNGKPLQVGLDFKGNVAAQ